MIFKIISKITNQPINLSDFDILYCKFAGIEVDKHRYANWFPYLEGVFYTFGDLADHAKNSYFYKGKLCIKETRKVSLHQAAQLMLVNHSMFLFSGEKLEDDYFRDIKDIVNFYQENDDRFYFIFSF